MRIDVLMPPPNKSRYGVIPHFTLRFVEALTRAGADCRILTAQRDNPKPFLDALFNNPPDCTLSFNGLLPDEQGRFFCDSIKIPHVACLTDPPTHYLVLAASPYTVIACTDRFSCDFFKGLGCKNVLFMPHGIEREIVSESTEDFQKRHYDVVMLSSGIDYETIAAGWAERFPKNIIEAMHESIDIVLSDNETSNIQAFVQTMDRHLADSRISPGIYNYPEIFYQVESYTKGRERVELVRAVKDTQVNIFGSQMDVWQKNLGKNAKNIQYHEAVNFDVALEVMKQSKILLNSCASLKDGIHERILSGIASGSMVITNENIYMREHFQDDANIGFYNMGKWDTVNTKIQNYLKNPEKMARIVRNGKSLIAHHHTWDHRAATLIKELKTVLKRVKEQV